ncbi:kelch repeat-containing protein [Myxococcota bacterium]
MHPWHESVILLAMSLMFGSACKDTTVVEGDVCAASINVQPASSDVMDNATGIFLTIRQHSQPIFDGYVDTPLDPTSGGVVPVTAGLGSIERPAIPPSEEILITLEVLNIDNQVISNGRTLPFDCLIGDAPDPSLFLARSDGFTVVTDTVASSILPTATPLADLRVLLIGGQDNEDAAADPVVRIYDHTRGTVCRDNSCVSGDAVGARVGHAATVMDDGQVLIHGGRVPQAGPISSAVVHSDAFRFDPSNGVIHQVLLNGDVPPPRHAHTATLLAGDNVPEASRGKILIAAGRGAGGTWLDDVHLLDPFTGECRKIEANLHYARSNATATMLSSGDVFIAGGRNGSGFLASVELFYAADESSWMPPDSQCGAEQDAHLCAARSGHTATLLDDGNVLLWGKSTFNSGGGDEIVAELFVIEDLRSIPIAAQNRQQHTASLLDHPGSGCPGGPCPVLILGGNDPETGDAVPAEIFWPTQGPTYDGILTQLPPAAGGSAREEHAVAPLGNGMVLVFGGRDPQTTDVVPEVETYNPCHSDRHTCPHTRPAQP